MNKKVKLLIGFTVATLFFVPAVWKLLGAEWSLEQFFQMEVAKENWEMILTTVHLSFLCLILATLMNLRKIKKQEMLEKELRFYAKKLEHSHRELEKVHLQNKLLLQAAGEGICGLDQNGNITFCNPAVLEMTGYTEKELIGKSQHEILHHSQVDGTPYPREECPIFATLQDGKVNYTDNEVFWRKDGTFFPAEYIVRPIYKIDRIGGAVVTFKNITKRKKTEEALQAAHDTLEQRVRERTAELELSNKNLEDFASIASHDLREPLRKIVNFGDRLTDTESHLTSQGKDYLERMQNASLRMQRLIDDLLNYSRVTSKPGSFERIDFKKVINQVVEDLDMKISEERGTVVVEEMPTLEANLFQMRQLFQNLIGNSLKYHREGVPPVVEVKSAKKGNGTWVIRVEDNGIGFEEKYAERIFKIFERLHGRSAYDGTGIGLAICERIVTRHKGTIRTESTVGEGATFVITLPEEQPLTD